MEVPQQRCSLTRKAPKLSRLQKPQPRKQPGVTNISNLQNVISNNCGNLQNSLMNSDSDNILCENNNNLPKDERFKVSSNNPQRCEEDVVKAGIGHIPNNNYSDQLLQEATSNLISSLNVISQHHLTSNLSCQRNELDVNANSLVTTTPDEVKRNLVEAMSQPVRKRAPRGNKLARPPPLKTKQPNYEALEMGLLNYIERLVDDSLSLQCSLQFRDFITKNGSQIDEKNRGLMDNCFDCIQEAITRNTLDSVVEINLKDILLLRRQNWQHPIVLTQTSNITWKDIFNKTRSSDVNCDDKEGNKNSTKGCTHVIQTQQSTDSGFGEDEVLWECEEDFRKELQEINRLDDIPEAECADKDISELLAGIRIIGENPSLVEEAEQILRTHFQSKKSESPPPVTSLEKVDVTTSPVDYMPPAPPKGGSFNLPDNWYLQPPPPPPPTSAFAPQVKPSFPTFSADNKPALPPKGDNFNLPDKWYLQPPPPPLPSAQEKIGQNPIRVNRQLSEDMQRCEQIVIRQPIGAGISQDQLEKIEKTMPNGIFTARGRRTMFSLYRDAMGKTSFPDAECASYKYTREELLACSDSIYAKEPPAEWSYLEKIYPHVCLKQVTSFFDRKLYSSGAQAGKGFQTDKDFPSVMWQSLAQMRRNAVPDHAVIQEETCTW